MEKNNRGAVWEIMERPRVFVLAFLSIFLLCFLVLGAVDALPNPVQTTAPDSAPNPSAKAIEVASPEDPTRIVAASINLDAAVANPASTDAAVLDALLLKGAVRYPTSAQLGVDGNVVIFGHSSYLPIVHNQAYKTFDGIQTLKVGATVSIYSATAEYRYRVVGVKIANATQDVIDLSAEGKHLTLVTCDSFTKKTDRFVVTADFVGTYSLVSN